MKDEVYISVDVETSGPIPNEYSMLSVGACVVAKPSKSFYVELKPINDNYVKAALEISKFDLKKLSETGIEPGIAIDNFALWVKENSEGAKPVFVGFNAGFDWSFVNWYFHKFAGENPFGFSALDIKAYYMGFSGCNWGETTSSQLPEEFKPSQPLTHNALDDARAQAEIFNKLLSLNIHKENIFHRNLDLS